MTDDDRLDRHPYQRDPQSGAGNCGARLNGKTCGRAERHVFHPHEFMLSGTRGVNNCVCTKPFWADCHVIPGIVAQ